MKRDTASTRRMQKRKAAKVEGTTKDKMKKTEEETVERQREEDISGKEQTEVKRKYLIPMRRIKYAAASSEKQEKPSSFVEVVERMTATKLLVNPKLLLIQLNIHMTRMERAVIDQYKVAAEKKLFTWIEQARRHAPLMFSPAWIDENLPTLQRSRGRKQERRRGEDISFISFVENSTNSGIILSPQLLMTSLNGLLLGEYIKEVDAGYIVIDQYLLAAEEYEITAEEKLFVWIEQARYHAKMIFTQTWIDENLPKVGRGT